MVNKYNGYGFLCGILGSAVNPVLMLVAGGGIILLADKKKQKDVGWGVVAGAGTGIAVGLALTAIILSGITVTSLKNEHPT